MHCNFKNEDGHIDGIMCGNSGKFCASEEWCTDSLHEKQFRWSMGAYQGDPDCYSTGI